MTKFPRVPNPSLGDVYEVVSNVREDLGRIGEACAENTKNLGKVETRVTSVETKQTEQDLKLVQVAADRSVLSWKLGVVLVLVTSGVTLFIDKVISKLLGG